MFIFALSGYGNKKKLQSAPISKGRSGNRKLVLGLKQRKPGYLGTESYHNYVDTGLGKQCKILDQTVPKGAV